MKISRHSWWFAATIPDQIVSAQNPIVVENQGQCITGLPFFESQPVSIIKSNLIDSDSSLFVVIVLGAETPLCFLRGRFAIMEKRCVLLSLGEPERVNRR